jgi:translation initiation factor 1A
MNMENEEEFGGVEAAQTPEGEQALGRVRLPRGKEVLGILEQRLGASRMMIKCLDGKTRNCRVPGRLKRKLWLREGDIVLVEPWQHQPDEKGDVIYKYSKAAAQWLKQRGFVKIEEEF